MVTGAAEGFLREAPTSKEINPRATVPTDTLLRAIPGVGIPLFKPVIGALHGYCVGMGMNLALHCDLRLAHPTLFLP